MPKIQSFSAPWLQEPNPGHKLFEQSEENGRLPASIAYSRNASSGPKRTIAQRGNEVFVASGREIRWGDIAYLKDAWEAQQSRTGAASHLNGDNSDSSFEVYDEETSRLPQGPGFRVCGFTSPRLGAYGASETAARVWISSEFLLTWFSSSRSSRPLSPARSGSWSSPLTRISWPS